MTQSAWDKLCPHSSLHIVSFFHSKFVAQPWRKFCSSSCKRNGQVSSLYNIPLYPNRSGPGIWFYCLCFLYTVQIKGTFNPRRQGRSVRNPYTQRNCCANFCTVICGPFPPRCVCVYVGGDYVTSGLLLASSLSGMNEGQAYFCPSSLLLPWLAFSSVYWTDEGSWMSLQ